MMIRGGGTLDMSSHWKHCCWGGGGGDDEKEGEATGQGEKLLSFGRMIFLEEEEGGKLDLHYIYSCIYHLYPELYIFLTFLRFRGP